MSRFAAWLIHGANLLVGGGGLVYAWMRYVATPPDPYALVGHSWQPAVQHLHVLAAPLLVFAIGLIWQAHVVAGLRSESPRRRASGVTLLATAAPMVVSGYLVQTATDPTWRQAWGVAHLATSGIWLLATLLHQLARRR